MYAIRNRKTGHSIYSGIRTVAKAFEMLDKIGDSNEEKYEVVYVS